MGTRQSYLILTTAHTEPCFFEGYTCFCERRAIRHIDQTIFSWLSTYSPSAFLSCFLVTQDLFTLVLTLLQCLFSSDFSCIY